MKAFLTNIDKDKMKMNWNKNPIRMDLFLSFLTVKVKIPEESWLGKCTGWTRYEGEDNLVITGGIVNGVEYLDHIVYKRNLDNPYNNYVNPFYLFDIMTEEGKKFFLDYYDYDITKQLENAQEKYDLAKKELDNLVNFWYKFSLDAGVDAKEFQIS